MLAFMRAATSDEAPPSEAAGDAGWPFFGQFVAHDITADRSALERTQHGPVSNARAPRLDLESVYGAGPSGSSYLFDKADPDKFLLSDGDEDLQRNRQGLAVIADPRNDSHLFMTQLQLAFQRAHNALVDRARSAGSSDAFSAARRSLIWHYQWIVAEEFLPAVAGSETVGALDVGQIRLPVPDGPGIPYEFADAAYRYGHAQVRERYMLRPGGPAHPVFPDLLGFRPLGPDRHVHWELLFSGKGARPDAQIPQRAMRIGPRLPKSLGHLPPEITGTVEDTRYSALANRDLRRGSLTDLPSGEAIATAMGLEPLARSAIGVAEWQGETPLSFYIAREAQAHTGGEFLGPVGGRIVAGVLLSLIARDPLSYRNASPAWMPDLAPADRFCLLDLLSLSR